MSQKQILLVAKLALIGVWLLGISGFFALGDPALATTLRRIFFALIVVHGLECAFFFKTLQGSGKPLAGQLLQTFVFGVVHYAELKTEQQTEATASPPDGSPR
jgi:uncharacterized protein YhhL (DUF1145 family)